MHPNKYKRFTYSNNQEISKKKNYLMDVQQRFSARPDLPWGPPSLLYKGYPVFPGGKVRLGRATDHSPPSSAKVLKEYSYTSTLL